MKKVDTLFLERNCPGCGPVKAVLDMNAVEDDAFRGRDDQELHVFSAQSPSASDTLLSQFDVEVDMPVLLISDGSVINSPKMIIEYLSKQGMSV